MRNSLIVILVFTELMTWSVQGRSAVYIQQTVARNPDSVQIQHGHQLFLQNCAICHGANAEGAPDWSRPDANGKYPPPPLNGSGHAWHHPQRALVATIKFGTVRIGGSMPAWQGKLSDQDIDDIIVWFQSLWPDELYAAWRRINHAAQQSK